MEEAQVLLIWKLQQFGFHSILFCFIISAVWTKFSSKSKGAQNFTKSRIQQVKNSQFGIVFRVDKKDLVSKPQSLSDFGPTFFSQPNFHKGLLWRLNWMGKLKPQLTLCRKGKVKFNRQISQ